VPRPCRSCGDCAVDQNLNRFFGSLLAIRTRPLFPWWSGSALLCFALTDTSEKNAMRHAILLLLLSAVPLLAQEDVGEVAFANSGAAEAQGPFRRGLALLHNFEYPYAREEFRKAQQIDPSFVMAYWGEAMTHTHPIWFTQDLEAARAVLQRLAATPAERLAKAKTDRERDYLAAVEVLYGEGTKNERDFKYADAMKALHARHPNDVDAAAFHALAVLGTTHQGRDFATYMRAAAILEEVFPANPRHPGVLHYLIHSYDDPIHAPLGLRAARVYGSVAPNAPHALHMTSHIFVALGMWDDVIAANRRAVDVTNRQLAERNKPKADCGHYVTWLHYGHLQKNDVAAARATLDACRVWAFDTPFAPVFPRDTRRARVDEYSDMRAHHVASGQPLSPADVAVTLPEGPQFLDARYTVAYGDVLFAAQRADAGALQKAVAGLRALHPQVLAAKKGDDNPAGRMRAEVMLQAGEALLLAAAGKRNEAIAVLEAARKMEEAMPIEFGPPVVAKPAAELLGDQLLAAGRAAEAEAAYRTALNRVPGRTILVAAHDRARGSAEKSPKSDDTKTVAPHEH
jgi:tetratricopeptide (TPR) repeat protein